ncbi:MAG: hypothetical protein RR543_00450 [Erysipelotrichales bacterium]
MWFTLAVIVVYLLFSQLDKILDALRSNDPKYRDKKLREEQELNLEREQLIIDLKSNIGKTCKLSNNNMYFMSVSKMDIIGKIIDVDNSWVEIETVIKKKKVITIIRIDDIYGVQRVIGSI